MPNSHHTYNKVTKVATAVAIAAAITLPAISLLASGDSSDRGGQNVEVHDGAAAASIGK